MKDQRSIDGDPTSYEKWDRAKSLMLESLHKPDNHLRSCAHNQKCYYELLEIRDQVLEMVQKMSNPRPYVDPKAPKSYEYAAHITMADLRRGYKGSSL